jgi:hypothetical protein
MIDQHRLMSHTARDPALTWIDGKTNPVRGQRPCASLATALSEAAE